MAGARGIGLPEQNCPTSERKYGEQRVAIRRPHSHCQREARAKAKALLSSRGNPSPNTPAQKPPKRILALQVFVFRESPRRVLVGGRCLGGGQKYGREWATEDDAN